jgi:Ni/Co efflux regulator RcnB
MKGKSDLGKGRASIAEIKMRKTLVTILCSALIAASSMQAAAAAEHHHTRKASRKPVMVNEQYRNSNNERPRDSNVGGTCGLFPGPCQ